MPTTTPQVLLLPPMSRLDLLLLLLWTKIRTQAQAYPIDQGGQSNIDASDVRLFACQNSGDAIELAGRCTHTLPKRTPWRYHEPNIITTSRRDSVYAPRRHRRQYDDDGDYTYYTYEYTDDDGDYTYYTYEYNPDPWTDLTSETWTDAEASSEPQTEYPTSAEYDGPTTPTDSDPSPYRPTSWLASESAPVAPPPGFTSGSQRTSRTDGTTTMNTNTAYSPSSSRGSIPIPISTSYPSPSMTPVNPTSAQRTTQPGTLIQPTTGRPTSTSTSTSTSSPDIIRSNTSPSLNVVAIETIYPSVPPNDSNGANPTNGGVINPYPSPARNPSNANSDSDSSKQHNGVVSSQGVPFGVIIGTVFGVIFAGLALFCLLFGINKMRQRKRDNESRQRARRLRMGMGIGAGSSSTLMLVHGQEATGASGHTRQGSIDTNEHGEHERGGILIRDGSESPVGSVRGGIRFANQRRPSSATVPGLPEMKDLPSTPLMQDWNSPSNVQPPPKHHVMERSHSPTVSSPLRTNPVTGRDSPSGWI